MKKSGFPISYLICATAQNLFKLNLQEPRTVLESNRSVTFAKGMREELLKTAITCLIGVGTQRDSENMASVFISKHVGRKALT